MSFAQEMKDFVSAYSGMTTALNNQQILRINRDKWRGPSDDDLSKIYSPYEHGAGGQGVGTVTMPAVSGDAKASGQKIYDFYRNKGLNPVISAGITGNLMQESGGDPRVFAGTRKGDAGQSMFAGQWNGPRLQKLYKYAGTQTPTLEQQLNFVLEEMNPKSPYVDQQAAAGFQKMQGAKTVEEATQLFRDNFERPRDPGDIKPRLAYANAVVEGQYANAPATFSFGDATQVGGGAIPDDTSGGNEPTPAQDDGSGDGQEAAPPEAQIDVPDAVDQTTTGAVLVPAEDQNYYDNYGYEEGGIIPDDTEFFQGGGMPTIENSAMAQLASSIRQRAAAPAQGASTGIPANMSFEQYAGRNPAPQGTNPNANTRNQASAMPRGGAPSIQQGTYGDWRKWGAQTPLQKQLADRPKPVVERPPPVAPTPAKKYSFDLKSLDGMPKRVAPIYQGQIADIMNGYNQAHPNGDDPVAFMRAQDAIKQITNRAMQGYMGGSQGGGAGYTTSGREEGGMVYPQFARGGPVRTSQTPRGKLTQQQFDELMKLEMRGRGNVNRGDPTQEARDRVAVRANQIERGGPRSSAYRPALPAPHPTAVGVPAKAAPRAPVQAENVPIPTPRPDYPPAPEEPISPPLLPDQIPTGEPNDYIVGGESGDARDQPQAPGTGTNVTITVPDTAPDDPMAQPPPLYKRGGAIPDDTDRRVPGGSGTTSRTGKRSSALAGKTTKGAADYLKAPRVKDTKKVRVRPMKGRGAAKRRSRPEASGVPLPKQRPPTFEIGQPGGDQIPTPTPRPTPGPTPQTVRPAGPPGTNAPKPYHFDQVSELIPRAPGITINVGKSGSGTPPGSMGVRLPGVNPPVTGYDVPQGGSWAGGQGPPPGPVDQAPGMPSARDMAYPFETQDAGVPPGMGPQDEPYLYARGGAVPDDEEGPYPNWRAEEAGYTTSSADADVRSATRAPAIPENVGDSPEFLRRMQSGEVPRIAIGDPRTDRTVQVTEPMPSQQPDMTGMRAQDTTWENAYQQEQGGGRRKQVDQRALAQDAMPAVRLGLQGLQRIFGIDTGEAVPSMEGGVQQSDGLKRMAAGHGRATKQEVQAIDGVFGIDQIDADEGMKNLIRIDKTVQYWLQKGDKDKAEAVAASLLQYGAIEVRHAGLIAKQFFERYQQTGNPRDLQSASAAIKHANELIPDGIDVEFNIDPKTHQLVATTVDADGQTQNTPIDPQAVPMLLQKAMNGSAYWTSVFNVGQPNLAKSQASADAKSADRAYQRDYDTFKFERQQDANLSAEQRRAAEEEYRYERGIETGGSAGERQRNADAAFFQDWSKRFDAAESPEDIQKLTEEGLGRRFQGTRDRQTPIADEDLNDPTALSGFDEADRPSLVQLGRSIAQKNSTLNAAGAIAMAAMAVTVPQYSPNADGTLNIGGNPLVFNPQLLPELNRLRQKYKHSAQ